ncbi:uncharacterized protein LOC143037877 isoform X2 [Oratosquilla oratoria]|uniref:uncharacterized protein LOC143037877 isoform X2 n=1 Tax=Oratosquilla oratoria TaxID=337810 RepID=UPI003F758539
MKWKLENMEGEDCFAKAGSNHSYEGGRNYFHTLRNLEPPPPQCPRAEEVGFDEREIPHRRFASYSQVKPRIIVQPRSLDVNEAEQQVNEDLPTSGGTTHLSKGCQLTITSVVKPQMHQQWHSGKAKHQEFVVCNICTRRFASVQHLKEHMYMVHEGQEERPRIGIHKLEMDTTDYTMRKHSMIDKGDKRKTKCSPQMLKPLISEGATSIVVQNSGKPRGDLLPSTANVINHSGSEHYITVGHTSRASLELLKQPTSSKEGINLGTNTYSASHRMLQDTSKALRHDCEDKKMRNVIYRKEGETSTLQRMHERTGEQVVTMFLDLDSSHSQTSSASIDNGSPRRWAGLNEENQETSQLDPKYKRLNKRQPVRVYGRKLAEPSVVPGTSDAGKTAVEGSFIGSSCRIAKGRRYIEKVAVGSTCGNGYDSDESEDDTLISRYDSQTQYTPTLSSFPRPVIKSEYYSHTLQTPNMCSTPSNLPFGRNKSKCESAHMSEDISLNLSNISANLVEENDRFYSSPVRMKRQQLAERAMQLRRAEEFVKQQEEEAQERTWQALQEHEAALREMEESLKQREAVAQKKIEQAARMIEESKKICDSKKFKDDENFLHLRPSTSQDEYSGMTVKTGSTSSPFQSAAQDQESLSSSKYSKYSRVADERHSNVEKRLKGEFKAHEKIKCSSTIIPHATELECEGKNQIKTLGNSIITNIVKVGNELNERKGKGCKKAQERAGAGKKRIYPWEMGEKISAIEPSKILRTYSRVKHRTLTENFSSSYLLSEVAVPPKAESVATVSVSSSGNLTIYSGHSSHPSEPTSETVYNEGATITITPVSHTTPKTLKRPDSISPHVETTTHQEISSPVRAGKKLLPSHFYTSDVQTVAEPMPGQIQVDGDQGHHGKPKVEQGNLKFYSHSGKDVEKAKIIHEFSSNRSLSGLAANSKGKMSPPLVTISVSEMLPHHSVKSSEISSDYSDYTGNAMATPRGFGEKRAQLFKVEPQLKAEVIDCHHGSQGEMEEPSTVTTTKVGGVGETVQDTQEKIIDGRNQFTLVSKLEGIVQNQTLVVDPINNQQMNIVSSNSGGGSNAMPFSVSRTGVESMCGNYSTSSVKKGFAKEAKSCKSVGSDGRAGTVKSTMYKKISAPVEMPKGSHGLKTHTNPGESVYVSQTGNTEYQMLPKMSSSIKHQSIEEPRPVEKLNIIDIPAGVEDSQRESFSFGTSTSASDSGVSEVLGEYNPATGTFITSDPALLQSLLNNKDGLSTISSVFLENLEKGHLSTKGLCIQHPMSDTQKVNVEIQTDDLPMIEACAHHFQTHSNASQMSTDNACKKELQEGSERDRVSLILSSDSTSIIKESFSSGGEGDMEIVSEGLRDMDSGNTGNVSSDEDMEHSVGEQDANFSDSEMGSCNQSSGVLFENNPKYQFHTSGKETVAHMKNFSAHNKPHFTMEKDFLHGVKVERNTFEVTENSSKDLSESSASGQTNNGIIVEHDAPLIVPERVHEGHDSAHLTIVSHEYSDSLNGMMNPMSDPLDVTVKKEFAKVVDNTVTSNFPESLGITVNSEPTKSVSVAVKKEPIRLLETKVHSEKTNLKDGSVNDKFTKSRCDAGGSETALPVNVRMNKEFMNSFEATLNGEPVLLINASLNKEAVLQSLTSENVQCVGDVTNCENAQVGASVSTTIVSAPENTKAVQPISYIVTNETMQSLDSMAKSGVKQPVSCIIGPNPVSAVNMMGSNGAVIEPKGRRVSRGGRRLKLKGWWDGVISESASSKHHVEPKVVEQREIIHCAKSNQSCEGGLEGVEVSISDPSKCILNKEDKPVIKKKGRPPVQKLITKKRRGGWQRKKPPDPPEPAPDDNEYVQIVCGKCEFMLESRAQFRTHIQEEHNGLARPKGESQEFDEKETLEIWKQTFKVTRRLKCPICLQYFKSLCGFKNHCTLCGRKSEELNTTCRFCRKKVRVHTLDKHVLKYHQNGGMIDKIDGLENCPGGKRPRRQAAASCNERLKFWRGNKTGESDVDISEKEDEFISKELNLQKFYSRPELVTVTDELVQQWEKSLSEQGIGSCSNENCSYQYDTICKAKIHYMSCEYSQVIKTFMCKMCEFNCTSEEEITSHITSEHSNCLVSSSDESEEEGVDVKIKKPTYKMSPGPIKPYPPSFKLALDFVHQNYSQLLFPTYWTCIEDWVRMNESELSQYLPELEVSPKVKYHSVSKVPGKNKKGEWTQLNRFEGKVLGPSPIMFCGGPVRACAWCPMPENASLNTSRQYIALATLPGAESEYKLNQSYVHKGVIQIWEVEALHPNQMGNDLVAPKMVLGIAHEYGAVWSLEWCPSGIYESPTPGHAENPLQRIGLLAASCSDGTIRIYIVPHPAQLSVENDSPPVFKKRPDLTLSPVMKLPSDIQCMKVNWFKGKGHNLVAGSFSNGEVCVWDVKNLSPLLNYTKDDGTQILHPFRSFMAHNGVCTSLSFCPTTGGRHLVTGGYDRTYKFWDLENTDMPLSITRKGLVLDTLWLPHWAGSFVAFDDVYGLGNTHSCFKETGYFGIQSCNVMSSNATVWTLSGCDWLNTVAQCDAAGEVIITIQHQLYKSYENDKFPSRRKVPICALRLEDLSHSSLISFKATSDNQQNTQEKSKGIKLPKKEIKPKKNTAQIDKEKVGDTSTLEEPEGQDSYVELPRTYQEMIRQYGLVFVDQHVDDFLCIPDTEAQERRRSDTMEPGPVVIYPLTSTTSVSWNNNIGAHFWLVVGTQAGLAKMVCVNGLQYPDHMTELNQMYKRHRSDDNQLT